MQIKQIAIVAALASSFAMPMAANASDIASLNGWGALFAAAHSGQQASAQGQGEVNVSLFQKPAAAQPAPEAAPAPESMPAAEPAPMAQAPEMENAEGSDEAAAADNSVGESAEADQKEMNQSTASASANLTATVNLSGDRSSEVLNTVDGVYQTAGNAVESTAKSAMGRLQDETSKNSGGSMAANMTGAGSLDVAGIASANLSSGANLAAGSMSGGQMGMITAMTSSLIQNVIAARPASLTGLLR